MNWAVVKSLLRSRNRRPYQPTEYWEGRAADLIETYDRPDTWADRGWMRSGIEEIRVPSLLARERVRSAFVVGAGSGRQYGFLAPLNIELCGIDVSPTLVKECRQRYPEITTTVDSIIGAEEKYPPCDCVLATAVLQHVPPDDISEAAYAVQSLAKKTVVMRELTSVTSKSSYMWAHDYAALFSDWALTHCEVTDETDDLCVTLMAWKRRRDCR